MHIIPHCIVLIVAAALLETAGDFTLYVIPDAMDTTQCAEYVGNRSNNVFCQRLLDYGEDNITYFKNDTRVIFLSGTYHLSYVLRIIGVRNFSLVGTAPQGNNRTLIQCVHLHNSGIQFIDSEDILIHGLTLIACGTKDAPSAGEATATHSALHFDHVVHLSLYNVGVVNSNGYGVNTHSSCGTITIEHSLFHHNRGYEYTGGNSRFFYGNCVDFSTNILSIHSSNFTNGQSSTNYGNAGSVGGIELLSYCPSLNVHISKAHVEGNLGGNMKLVMKDFLTQVWSIFITDSVIANGRSHSGAGLTYSSKLYTTTDPGKCQDASSSHGNILKMSNTTFTGNRAETQGGALLIGLFDSDCERSNIEITQCYFVSNSVTAVSPNVGQGAAIYIAKQHLPGFYKPTVPAYTVKISGAHFHDNYVTNSSRRSSILEVIRIDSLNLSNCNFLGNTGTAISMKSSNIIVTGHFMFRNNTGLNGGALRFCAASSLFINNNTSLIFQNNHALETGGAIFVEQSCTDLCSPCFFQPNVHVSTDVDNLGKEIHMHLHLLNNSAEIAGDAIYGGDVDSCYTYGTFTSERLGTAGFTFSKAIMKNIFSFASLFNTSSLISSDAYKVQFCD